MTGNEHSPEQPGRSMWWTQPRLSAVACALHAIICSWVVRASPEGWPQATTLAISSVALVIGYRAASLALARRHETGALQGAFESAVWRNIWRRADPFEFCDLATALDERPGNGASDPERFRQPLAAAMNAIEAARFRVPENTGTLAVSLLLSWLALQIPWGNELQRFIGGGVVVPFAAISFLGILVDRAAMERLLRLGFVSRVAFLAPRTFVDIGLGSWGFRLQTLLFAAFCVVALVAVWFHWTDDRARSFAALAVAAYTLLIILAENFVLQRLPLLRFPGPPEISAFVDHQIRTARIMLIVAPGGSIMIAAGGLFGDFNFVTGLACGLVVMAVFGFAWRPHVLAQRKSPRELASHLHDVQRRWGLNGGSGLPTSASAGVGEAGR